MKRLCILPLLGCLLLTGCNRLPAQPTTKPTAAPTTTSTAASTTQTTVKTTTTKAPKTVTVYLRETATHSEDGRKTFAYDENHNVLSATRFTAEGEQDYVTRFEEPDANGMPSYARRYWSENDRSNTTLTYTADSKLERVEKAAYPFNGYTFTYDDAGRLTARDYHFNGVVEQSLTYKYTKGKLVSAQCLDAKGKPLYDIQVKDGCIVKEDHNRDDRPYVIVYKYDKHGNLSSESRMENEQTIYTVRYTYKTVKVPAARAPYIREQQTHLALLG